MFFVKKICTNLRVFHHLIRCALIQIRSKHFLKTIHQKSRKKYFRKRFWNKSCYYDK